MVITDSIYELRLEAKEILFPEVEPYNEGMLQVTELHQIWYAEYGAKDGVPLVVVHGGPGGGSWKDDMRFCDPKHYRIILFDQRGAGRSRPFGEIRDNVTSALIEDIECLRRHLKVEKWILFGNSWGTALSMLYGETYPDACLGFILRGTFLASRREIDQARLISSHLFPDLWSEFISVVSAEGVEDVTDACYRRIMSSDVNESVSAALSFLRYNRITSFLFREYSMIEREITSDLGLSYNVARIFHHYAVHNFFVRANRIIDDLHRIAHLPAIIVHGRYDLVCNMSTAYRVHKAWPNSDLVIVRDAGHSILEEGIMKAIVDACSKMLKICEVQPV